MHPAQLRSDGGFKPQRINNEIKGWIPAIRFAFAGMTK
jgi:hypothetical protein